MFVHLMMRTAAATAAGGQVAIAEDKLWPNVSGLHCMGSLKARVALGSAASASEPSDEVGGLEAFSVLGAYRLACPVPRCEVRSRCRATIPISSACGGLH